MRRLIVSAGKGRRGLDHKTVMSCSLALVEAVNNVIFHAHKKDREKWIDISIDIRGGAVEIDVSDLGEGFDLPASSDLPDGKTHGRGLFIIRTLMHEVRYMRGRKNVLKMIYYL